MNANKVAVAFILAAANTVHAQLIVLSDPRDFQSSISTLIDFEVLPNGEPLPPYSAAGISNQWSGLGVLISNPNPGDGVARWRSTGPEIPSHSGTNGISRSNPVLVGGSLQFTFVDSVSLQPALAMEAGLWVQNGYSFPIGAGSVVTFFDINNNPIYSSSATTRFDEFIGIRYQPGISSIRISDPDYFLADDLQFGPLTAVPEPSTWALLVGGSLALFALRKRS